MRDTLFLVLLKVIFNTINTIVKDKKKRVGIVLDLVLEISIVKLYFWY